MLVCQLPGLEEDSHARIGVGAIVIAIYTFFIAYELSREHEEFRRSVRDFAEVWFSRADVVTFHDPLAAACIFESDLCLYAQGKVHVSLDPLTLGEPRQN